MGIFNFSKPSILDANNEKVDDNYDLNYDIKQGIVVVFVEPKCKDSQKVQEMLKSVNVKPVVHDVANSENSRSIKKALKNMTGKNDVPYVFVVGKYFGGVSEVETGVKNHSLQKIVNTKLESIGSKLT